MEKNVFPLNKSIANVDFGDIYLHKDIINILFQHKEEIYRHFIDIKGIFMIEHIAIKIINPNNEMIIFSITPSVEYNLIAQGLWKYDYGFSPYFLKKNTYCKWGTCYSNRYFHEIKFLKEHKHGFNFGFNLLKEQDNFNLIYSFATRSKNSHLDEYYRTHINEIYSIGDYGYKLIHPIYSQYITENFKAPSVANTKNSFVKSFLKLIINNS